MSDINTYTIGFTNKSAAKFFELIRNENIKTLIDVRLNVSSQLAGFAKKKDLEFFLKELCNLEYQHHIELAPTKKMLDTYKKHKGDWNVYEAEFMELMTKRGIEKIISKDLMKDGCLLCSEDKPHHCHRRLVVEYLHKEWNIPINVKHLY